MTTCRKPGIIHGLEVAEDEDSDDYLTDCESDSRAIPKAHLAGPVLSALRLPKPPSKAPPNRRLPGHLATRLRVLTGRLPPAPPRLSQPNALMPFHCSDPPDLLTGCKPRKSLPATCRHLNLQSLPEPDLSPRHPLPSPHRRAPLIATFDQVKHALARLRLGFDLPSIEILRSYAVAKVEPHSVDLEEVVAVALQTVPDLWTASLFDEMLFKFIRFGPMDDDSLSAQQSETDSEDVDSSTILPQHSVSQVFKRSDFRRFRHHFLTHSAEVVQQHGEGSHPVDSDDSLCEAAGAILPARCMGLPHLSVKSHGIDVRPDTTVFEDADHELRPHPPGALTASSQPAACIPAPRPPQLPAHPQKPHPPQASTRPNRHHRPEVLKKAIAAAPPAMAHALPEESVL